MSSNLINPDYSPLRSPEEDSGGGGSSDEPVGLIDGLENFIEENPDAEALDTPSGGDSEEEAPAKVEPSDSEDVDDLGLPVLGKKKDSAEEPADSSDPSFDEDAFDKETEQEIKSLDPGKGEAWKKLKDELKNYKQGEVQLPELQQKLESLEKENLSLRETADEVEAIKARMKSVTSRNAELLLEESQEYQSSVVRPHQEISKTIDALAEAKDVAAEEIWAVIKQPNVAKRIAMLDELEKSIGGRNSLLVQNMAEDMRTIAFKDKEMREQADDIVNQSKTADARIRQEETESRISDFKVSAKEAFNLHASKIPGFSDDSGSLTEEGRSAQAHASTVDISSLSSGDLAYMAFTTEALPHSLRKIKALEKENRDLRVAAGDKSSDIIPGESKRKTTSDDSDSEGNGPMGLLDHMAKQTFDAAV